MSKSESSPLAYTLRTIPPELWHRVKTKALAQHLSVKDVILELLAKWVKA